MRIVKLLKENNISSMQGLQHYWEGIFWSYYQTTTTNLNLDFCVYQLVIARYAFVHLN